MISRRQIVGSVGLAAIAGSEALGQKLSVTEQSKILQSPEATAMQNPLPKYPRPPFKQQSQPWPGLASKMDPKPDHGETSYRGSGRLAGRKALVTGGDSGMGRAAAIAFAREGADVAINYLPEEDPDAQEVLQLIKSAGRVGLGIPGDLRDEAFCKQLVVEAINGLGGLANERFDRGHNNRAV